MALNAKKVPKTGGNFVEQPVLEPSTYPARIVQVLDLGMQAQRPYKGEAKPPAHEIMITYELLDEFMLDADGEEIEDKPRWLSETFPLHNLEADLAKSTKRYKALDPDDKFDGDFTLLVESPCMVTTANNAGQGKNVGKTYTNVMSVSVMRTKDARNAPALVNPPKVFVLDEPDMTIFKSLPEWLQEKISTNLEMQGSALEEALEDAPDEEEEEEAPKAKAKPKKPAKAPAEPAEEEEDDMGEEDEPKW